MAASPHLEIADHTPSLQERLRPILTTLERFELIQFVNAKQNEEFPLAIQVTQRQSVADVQERLMRLHPGEVAHLLEMLPTPLRVFVWKQLDIIKSADVVEDLPLPVLDDLLVETQAERLDDILREVEPERLAELVDDLEKDELKPPIQKAIDSLSRNEREWVALSRSYGEDDIGEHMSMDFLWVADDKTVQESIETLQDLVEMPHQSDKIFVLNIHRKLVGVVPIIALLRHKGHEAIAHIMNDEPISFLDTDPIEEAISTFGHRDLVSAAVVDRHKRVVGRLTVETIGDLERERAEEQALAREGLSSEVDLFGPILESARQRWAWLAVNLMTAFIASRCISLFQDTITELVALATLMPIVASLGGNTGNQTIALFVRGLVLEQISTSNIRHLVIKELSISALNGIMWGSALGLLAGLLYGNLALGCVMGAATALNLILAAGIGMATPLAMEKLGKDPAIGSSVVLTFCTDSLGFLIFLGLASFFLV